MARIPRDQIDVVRQFNRLYTRRIGVLDEGHLGSRFSLTEVRVLYELANGSGLTAGRLRSDLGLDAGYLSRILRRFERMALITRQPSPSDGRVSDLKLTRAGRAAFAQLNRKAHDGVAGLLAEVPVPVRPGVLRAMKQISAAIEPPQTASRTSASWTGADEVVLRDPRPGDMGWVVHRHGALYAQEYGYNEKFEAIVAHVVAEFIDNFDAERERCWIAERGGEIIGSVFLVSKSATVAKLRLLYLEPSVRGRGLGRRLVQECIAFARSAGYRKLTLWTQSSLTAARHIYEASGFELKHSSEHSDFGPRERAETWELSLRGSDRS